MVYGGFMVENGAVLARHQDSRTITVELNVFFVQFVTILRLATHQ